MRTRQASIGLCLWSITTAGLTADDWDVADTGQPYRDVEFAVTEGTWMSVDVSPDGRVLAFDLLGDIYTVPADGGDALAVHAGPAMQVAPTFNADGTKLLYLSDASGADNVWMSNVDGSAARPVTHETRDMLAEPAWGPQGESVFAVRTSASYLKRELPEICLFDLSGGNGQVVVESPQSGKDVQEARVSPDGRFLYYTERVTTPAFVYVDANHMNYVIRRRELSTGSTEQVVGGFGGATTPQLSRDGKRLAFVRRVMSKTVLFVMDPASGAQRPVYDGLDRDHQASYAQQGNYYPHFGWFPDNRHVAIWGKGKLYRVDMDTGAAQEIPFRVQAKHRITNSFRVEHDLAPAQFPVRTVRQLATRGDARSIVFTAVGHLWRKPLPNGPAARITKATPFEFEPAYSADGHELAYVEWDDERGSALKVLRDGSSKARTVASSRSLMREPAFSPDGKWLVFRIQSGDKAMGGFRVKPGIYVVSAAGGNARFLSAGEEAPRFSPDGTRIYFVTVKPTNGLVSQTRTLVSVTLDGLNRREHAHTVDTDTLELRLSPDQRWIAFRERQQYYVMPFQELGAPLVISATSTAVPVVRLTGIGGYSLTWASDSASLHWTLGSALYRADVASFVAAKSGTPQSYADIDVTLPTGVPQGTLAFVNARLITMRGDEVIERGTVVVERNRIAAIGPADSVAVPAGARVIDAAGKTIMPGLIDMHWHNFTDANDRVGANPQQQPSRYAALAYGLTTNYDPYSTPQLAYESGETTLAGITVSPRWVSSGPVIYGRPQMSDATYVPVDTYEDARTAVMRQRAMGGTIIKSYRQPTRKQRQMLVKAGREAGIMVDVEGEGQFYRNLSEILDGHTDLQHNLPVANYYEDVVQLMKHGTTPNTPVLLVIYGELFGENYLYQTQRIWTDPRIRAYVPEIQASAYSPLNLPASAPPYARSMTSISVADESLWDVGFRSVSRSLKKLDDAGVIVNAGSHGAIPGLGLHWEMWLLAEGGMSNHRVLRTATINGATTLGLQRQIGSLETGKLADLIVLDANPLENIRNSTTVRYTMVNGRLYDSLSMDEIGNYDRPRRKFYWEREDYHGIEWNESWTGQ